ncbi:MAG TPA: hypothetical protein VKD90_11920 [Gemmataceae bacterium]|nr:hypothetical protein [Gemmataceae bacterium]
MDAYLRRAVYLLMLTATTGVLVARVANVEFLYEPSFYKVHPTRKWPDKAPNPWPTFSSNDRARWATVKALVEDGTFVIGRRVPDAAAPKGYRDEGITFTEGFGSVDKVLHPERQEFFSTKPPLLTLFVAGQYWVLNKYLHKDMVEDKWEVAVPILLVTNVLPLVLALWLLSRLLERYGSTDWGRLFTFATACFGTFLPTFATTLNNHVPAACCVMYAVYALFAWTKAGNRLPSDVRNSEWYPQTGVDAGPEEDNPGSPMRLFVVGLFAGLAVCMDLPAAAFAGAVALVILAKSPRGLVLYIPGLLLPIAAQAAVNYQAVGTWEPVYAKFGGPWYEYEGSHWAKPKLWEEGKEPKPEHPGIDFADEPKEEYALHFLVGHHGLFSLTPVWLLSLAGLALTPAGVRGVAVWLHRLTLLVAAAVIGFYIWRTNNYGGYSSGPRWLFWLTPLFLLAMLPAADAIGRSRVGRGIAYLLLGVSVFSATYPWTNPWRHPWAYQWCEYMGWVNY